MRSDKLLGTFEAKLSSLESKAELHECLDLLEGRKAVGGRLEFRVLYVHSENYDYVSNQKYDFLVRFVADHSNTVKLFPK